MACKCSTKSLEVKLKEKKAVKMVSLTLMLIPHVCYLSKYIYVFIALVNTLYPIIVPSAKFFLSISQGARKCAECSANTW